jgi:CBS domain containing-hemolysin-like protein
MAALIGILLGSLALSACGSLLEASLHGLSREDIARLCSTKPRAGRTLRFFKEELHGFVLAVQILRILVQSAGAVLSGVLVYRLFGPAWLVPFALLYGLLLVLGSDILARALGTRYARGLAPWLALPLEPLLWVLSLSGRFRGRRRKPLRGRKRGRTEAAAIQEVSALLRLASLNAWQEGDQARIFSRAQDLSRLKVKDIMVEREAVNFLSSDMSLSQALVEAHLHHHTRFPLARGQDPNEVIGYVNFKDIVSALQLNPVDPTLAGICRPIMAVETGDSLSFLLDRMTREYQHIVMVKDRQGRIAGLATLEDALEAVLGGTSEKADRLPDYCYPIAENRYVAGGGVSVQTLRRKLSLSLPDLDGSLDSMLRQLCRGTPSPEQKVTVMGITFTVRRMSGAHIREVVIDGRSRAKRLKEGRRQRGTGGSKRLR